MRTCPTCHYSFQDDISFCPRDGTPLQAPPTLAETGVLGSISGRYRIIRPLGAGGMGSVFLAEQLAVGNRLVAIKLLARKLLDVPEFLERFRNEAASTGRIRHSNVVTIYESGQADDGTPYIAMEYLEGKTLRQTIDASGRLPALEASEILQQAARGLNAAHKIGIIHRDLKPDNIFLTRGDEGALLVKVMDFGIAKLREAASHTMTGSLLGTPAYMSFEQAAGMRSDDLDARSDVYSLGIVVYETLTGRVPFQADTSLGYIHKQLTEPPAPLRTVQPELPSVAQIEPVLVKALEKDRDRRYSSVLDFARTFAAAVQSSGTIGVIAELGASPDARPLRSAPDSRITHSPWESAPRPGPRPASASPRESDVAVQTPPPILATGPTPPAETPARFISGPQSMPQLHAANTGSPSGGEISVPGEDQREPVSRVAAGSLTSKARTLHTRSRESRREERMRRRMARIGRRLESLDPERPLWRRPLPVALLSVLLLIAIRAVFHRGPGQNTVRPGPPAANRSLKSDEAKKFGEEAARWAMTQKDLGTKQAEKAQEEILSELRKNGLLGNAPAGEHPAVPVPPTPQVLTPSLPGQTTPKIMLAPFAPRPWQGELKQGELVGQQFVDGGLKLQNESLSADLLARAPAGSIVTVELEINSEGKVYKGRRLAGDRGLAKAVIRVARDGWQFNPPRVNGVPVRVIAAVSLQF